MKCPNCNKEPMTFLKFSFMPYSQRVTCHNCGAILKPSSALIKTFWVSISYLVLLAGFLFMSMRLWNWSFEKTLVLFFSGIIIIGFPIEYFSWKFGRFEFTGEFGKTPEKVRKRSKKIIIALSIIIGLFFVKFLYDFVNSFDISPPDVSDLTVQIEDVPDDENAFPILIRIADSMSLSMDEIKIFIKENQKLFPDIDFAASIVDRYSGKLFELRSALKMKYFQVPKADRNRKFNDYSVKWAYLAQVMSLESLYYLRADDHKQALDIAMQIIQLGQRLEGCRGSLWIYDAGTNIKIIGLKRLSKIISETVLYDEEFAPHIKELEQYATALEDFTTSIKVSYSVESKEIEEMLEYELGSPDFDFLPNKTKKLSADIFRDAINNFSKPLREYSWRKVPALEQEFSLLYRLFVPNNEGRFHLRRTKSVLEDALKNKCRESLFFSAVRLVAAIRLYYHENRNQLPESLNALVPKYIMEVPLDPYDGKPVRYSKDKSLIYFVGEDTKDDGGDANMDFEGIRRLVTGDLLSGKDLVVPLYFPKKVVGQVFLRDFDPATEDNFVNCQKCGDRIDNNKFSYALLLSKERKSGDTIEVVREETLLQLCEKCIEDYDLEYSVSVFSTSENNYKDTNIFSFKKSFICSNCGVRLSEEPYYSFVFRIQNWKNYDIDVLDAVALVNLCEKCRKKYDFTKIKIGTYK
jgi:hypothetical protein